MFRQLQRELRQMEGSISIPVEIELDENGCIDRCCPSEDCGVCFKLVFEDWENIVSDEVVYCPLCRHAADCTQWNTLEQSEYHKSLAIAQVQKTIGSALRRDADRLNSDQKKNQFIRIKMSHRPNRLPVAIPASATAAMTQEFQCVECRCRYSSIGISYFCPACGHSSVFDAFFKSIDTVSKTVEALPVIRQALVDFQDKNVAEDSVRQILESELCKVVAYFQKYAESCFSRLTNSGQFTLRRNVFQRLEESDTIWRNASSKGYTDILSDSEYRKLNVYFQQRHLLEHRDGIVDKEYIDRAMDDRFAVGQRLVVSDSNVSELTSIVKKLALAISNLEQ